MSTGTATTTRSINPTDQTSHLWMKYIWGNLQRFSNMYWNNASRNAVKVAHEAYKQGESLGEPTRIIPWTPARFTTACEEFHNMEPNLELKWWVGRNGGSYWNQKVDHRYNTAILLASGVLPFNAENESVIKDENKGLVIQNWIEGVWKGVHGISPPDADGNFFRALAECAENALKEVVEPVGVKKVLGEIKFGDSVSCLEIVGRSDTFDKFAGRIRELSVQRKVWGDDTPSYDKPLYDLRVGEFWHHKRENIFLIALAALNAQAEWESMPKKPAIDPPEPGEKDDFLLDADDEPFDLPPVEHLYE